MKGLYYSVVSGCLASIAAVFGKLAVSNDELDTMLSLVTHRINNFGVVFYVIKVIMIIIMVLVNMVMWTTFTKALNHCKTTIEATVLNTASNFLLTAAIGATLFDENVNFLWFLGLIMITVGLVMIKMGEEMSRNRKRKKSK